MKKICYLICFAVFAALPAACSDDEGTDNSIAGSIAHRYYMADYEIFINGESAGKYFSEYVYMNIEKVSRNLVSIYLVGFSEEDIFLITKQAVPVDGSPGKAAFDSRIPGDAGLDSPGGLHGDDINERIVYRDIEIMIKGWIGEKPVTRGRPVIAIYEADLTFEFRLGENDYKIRLTDMRA